MRKDIGCLLLVLVSSILINYQLFIGQMQFDFDNLVGYPAEFSLALLRPLLLWDPYQFSGFPVFAEPQYAMFYPLRWIFNFIDVFTGLHLFYILHYILGIVFMYLFLRSRSLGRTAATGGTLCYVQGSYLQAKLMITGTLFFSMVWIPLFFLFAFRAIENQMPDPGYLEQTSNSMMIRWYRNQRLRNTIYAGWILGIISLIGSPHHMFYPVLVVCIYLLFTFGMHYNQSPKTIYQKFVPVFSSSGLAVLMALIGIGISAIQLIPSQELFRYSIRANLSFHQVTESPLKPEWILASFLGGTQTPEFLDALSYFGVAGLLLILYCFIFNTGKSPTQSFLRDFKINCWFWLTISIISILIARGENTPFYSILYHLPLVKSLSFPCRSLILLAFAGAVLTAYGIDTAVKMEIRNPKSGFRNIKLLVSSFFLLVSLVILGYFFYRFGNFECQTLLHPKWADAILFRWSNLCLFTGLTALVLILYIQSIIRLRIFQILILVIIIVDFQHFSPRLQKRFIDLKEYLTPPDTARYLQQQIKSPSRFIGFEPSRLYTTDQNDNRLKKHLTPKLGDLYRLQDAQGYDPMMLQRYVTLMRNMAGQSPTSDPQRMANVAECNPRFLNLLNIEYIVGEVNETSIHRTPIVLASKEKDQITIAIDTPCIELGIISLLDRHLETPQGTLIGTITVIDTQGEQEKLPIRAGIETADWRSETTPGAHRMPSTPAMTWIGFVAGQEYTLHNFYTRIRFSRPQIPKSIVFNHEPIPGVIVVQNVTLIKQNDKTQFERLAEFGDMRIYRNKTVYPRAFLVHHVEVIADTTALLATLVDNSIKLDKVAYVEEQLPEPLVPVQAEEIQSVPKITKYQANQIELETGSQQNSFLVLSELDYPGWQAFVDGKRTKIYTTDYILRGIYLPSGKHTVIFRFRPSSLSLGAFITILTLLITILGIMKTKP